MVGVVGGLVRESPRASNGDADQDDDGDDADDDDQDDDDEDDDDGRTVLALKRSCVPPTSKSVHV